MAGGAGRGQLSPPRQAGTVPARRPRALERGPVIAQEVVAQPGAPPAAGRGARRAAPSGEIIAGCSR